MPRFNVNKRLDAVKPLFALGEYVRNSGLGQNLIELVQMRVSQLNGCAYCLDMHSKDARAAGETEQRLYLLQAWRGPPYIRCTVPSGWHGFTCRLRCSRTISACATRSTSSTARRPCSAGTATR